MNIEAAFRDLMKSINDHRERLASQRKSLESYQKLINRMTTDPIYAQTVVKTMNEDIGFCLGMIDKNLNNAENNTAKCPEETEPTYSKEDINLVYFTGVFNVSGLEGLSKEIARLDLLGLAPCDIIDKFRTDGECALGEY